MKIFISCETELHKNLYSNKEILKFLLTLMRVHVYSFLISELKEVINSCSRRTN